MRNELLLSIGLLCLDAGLAEAQIGPPSVLGDGATTQVQNGTISTLTTDSGSHTYTAGVTIAANGILTNKGAQADNYSKYTGAAAQTIGTLGGCLILEGSATSVTVTATTLVGKSWCVENYESVSITVTTPNYSMYLHSATGVTTTVLTSGSTVHMHSDGTNYFQD